MSTDLTATLAAWKAVADASTEGPWLYGGQGWVFAKGLRGNLDPQMPDLVATASTRDDDAEFIALSRTIVPALLSAVEGVLVMHRRVHPVFNWQTGLRLENPCPECDGRAGVHPCGCWADDDMQYECEECSDWNAAKGTRVPWPCPTVKTLTDALGGA